MVDAASGYGLRYDQLWDYLTRFSSFLMSRNVKTGDRLFSVLPNSMEQMLAFLSALWLGLEFCPLSPNLTSTELNSSLKLYQPVSGLVPLGMPDNEKEVLAQFTSNKTVIDIPVGMDLGSWIPKKSTGIPSSLDNVGRLLLLTSGTTSAPKSIVLNGDKLWSSAIAWTKHHNFLDYESRFYNFLPMSYLGGLFNLGLIPLACHGSSVLSTSDTASLLLGFWKKLSDLGVNILWLPPTMLRSLLTIYKRRTDTSIPGNNAKACFLGMAPAAMHEKEDFESTFEIPVLENFALSETTFLTSEEIGSPNRRLSGSVGTILPWAGLRLEPLERDPSKFEIQVKTPFLFDGYLDQKGEIFLPTTSAGFFPTGDLGEFNGDLVVLKGRSKEVIKKGGFLVSLQDLEEIAYQHPRVSQAAAIAVQHEFYGESAILCIRVREDDREITRRTLHELVGIITGEVSRFKWPESIALVESFPSTESGKVQKWLIPPLLESKSWIVDQVDIR